MEKKLETYEIKRKHIFSYIFLIIIGGLVVRFYFFPYDLPITFDGSTYFSYAIDTMILGQFPSSTESYTSPLANNGWPVILSSIFSIFNFDTALEFMNVQRHVSICFSVLTAIPVYLLSRKFFGEKLSILCAVFVVFEPRIIQNSVIGVTEPIFIFLTMTSLAFFLSENKKLVYISFWIIGLTSMIRYEGLILLIPFTIMFFVRYRKEGGKNILKYFFIIGILFLIILPMAYARYDATGNDGFTTVFNGPKYLVKTSSNPEYSDHKTYSEFIFDGVFNLSKYFGWSLIPSFLIFIPLGLILFFKNLDFKKTTIIITSIFLLMPAFYAYSRDFQEIRYLFVIYPILSIVSIFAINFILKKIMKPRNIIFIIAGSIVISSVIFVDYQIIDYEHEREALEISRYIFENTDFVNDYYPQLDKLVYLKYEYNEFPILSYDPQILKGKVVHITDENLVLNKDTVETIPRLKASSVIEYIDVARNYGLTHIVTDGNNARPDILNDIFKNENKYPFAIKEFDSLEYDFNYHVKIFKINYGVFDKELRK